jgi:hypothetical protein
MDNVFYRDFLKPSEYQETLEASKIHQSEIYGTINVPKKYN